MMIVPSIVDIWGGNGNEAAHIIWHHYFYRGTKDIHKSLLYIIYAASLLEDDDSFFRGGDNLVFE